MYSKAVARQLATLRQNFPGWDIYRFRVRGSGQIGLLASLRRPLTDQLRAGGVCRFIYRFDVGELAAALTTQAERVRRNRVERPLTRAS
ncbi:hypothetical protein ACFOY2_12590 [Nonomuraea purpurea]|uniref:Uncharacterized protein n=1 Tax=Nonomuraea purpurea TaxID=1849276 RepID=A0ABV8G5D8_9ACTN